MQRLLAILLLVAFGLPFAEPLFALGAPRDAGVPACCRREGSHHCMMSVAERRALLARDRQVSGPQQRCPFRRYSVQLPPQLPLFTTHAPQSGAIPVASHPAGVPQAQSRWRIARDRSRQKRGPPTVFSL